MVARDETLSAKTSLVRATWLPLETCPPTKRIVCSLLRYEADWPQRPEGGEEAEPLIGGERWDEEEVAAAADDEEVLCIELLDDDDDLDDDVVVASDAVLTIGGGLPSSMVNLPTLSGAANSSPGCSLSFTPRLRSPY